MPFALFTNDENRRRGSSRRRSVLYRSALAIRGNKISHHFDMFRRGIKRWNIFIFSRRHRGRPHGFARQSLPASPDNPQQSPGTSPVYDLRLFSEHFQRFVGIRHQPGFPAKARLKGHHHFFRCHPQCGSQFASRCAATLRVIIAFICITLGNAMIREQQQIRFAMFGKEARTLFASALM